MPPAGSAHSSPLAGAISRRRWRCWRAVEVYRCTGEAEDWYAALGEDSPHGFVYLAPSLLRRAELLERRGEHAGALELHARYTALWQGCDAELQPLSYTSP